MSMAFIWGLAKENSRMSLVHDYFGHVIKLESWQLCHDMLCEWKMSYSQKLGYFEQFEMKFVTLKVWGAIWGHFGRFRLFHGASNMCTEFFLLLHIHPIKLCTTVTLSWGGKKKKIKKNFTKLPIICENFGSHIWATHETTPKTSNANLTKIPICLKYEGFICYFGPHGSGQHPTPIHAFHPRWLPPSGSQNPNRILGGDPFHVAGAFNG